jgi:hypothetical protein
MKSVVSLNSLLLSEYSGTLAPISRQVSPSAGGVRLTVTLNLVELSGSLRSRQAAVIRFVPVFRKCVVK